jgi:hypothetical protein
VSNQPTSNLYPISTQQQAAVLHRYAVGDTVDNIVATTSLNKEFVAAIVTDVAKFDRGRARTLVQEYMARNIGERLSAEPCEEIMTRGHRSFDPRARHLAKRIQDSVEALRIRLIEVAAEQEQRDRQAAAEKVAREKVAKARAELAAALAELAAAGGGKTTKTTKTAEPTPPVGPAPKAVRAWAKQQRIDVPAAGRVPQRVVDAYLTANPPKGATS